MFRLSLIAGLAALLVACLGGDDATPSPSPTGTGTAETTASPTGTPPSEAPTPTSTPRARPATPTPQPEPDTVLMQGRHFRGQAPDHWLLVEPGTPLTPDQRATIERLAPAILLDVERAAADSGPELIFTGLLDGTDDTITVASICDRAWERGAGDWNRLMELTFRSDGIVVDIAGAIARIEGYPYPVYTIGTGAEQIYAVHPTSVDGCNYGFSRSADPAALDAFVAFLDTVELGREQGMAPQRAVTPLRPAEWLPLVTRTFDAATPHLWFYNDPSLPLTNEQLAVIESLPPEAAAIIRAEQEQLGSIQLIYPDPEFTPDAVITTLAFCDLAFVRTPEQWAEEMVERRSEDADVSTVDLTAVVDGRPHEVYQLDYGDWVQYNLFVVGPDGCNYVFGASPHDLALGGLVDFMMFVETIDFRVPTATGSSSGRRFEATIPAAWVEITTGDEAGAGSMPDGLAADVARDIRVHLVEHPGAHLFYLSLPANAGTYIVAHASCRDPGLSPERWESEVLSDLERDGLLAVHNGTRVTIEGREYRLRDVTHFLPEGRRVEQLAMPVSIDGCGYTFTLTAPPGDAESLAAFVEFLETLRLGRDL